MNVGKVLHLHCGKLTNLVCDMCCCVDGTAAAAAVTPQRWVCCISAIAQARVGGLPVYRMAASLGMSGRHCSHFAPLFGASPETRAHSSALFGMHLTALLFVTSCLPHAVGSGSGAM